MQKEDFYKGVKTAGFAFFIPFMLAAGPLTGYFMGAFIQKRFNLAPYCVFLGVALGFLVAITEVIKILKAVAKVNKK